MATSATSTSSIGVQDLRCEYQDNPLGIDVRQPRLSWKLVSPAGRGTVQTAYQLRVNDEKGELWDSGKVPSGQSVHVPYAGPELRSAQRYTWQVRIWDGAHQASTWSEPAWWEMGLLHSSDWQAKWIEADWDDDPQAFKPAPYLRTAFTLDKPVASARLYVTAHGLYELSLNGQRVGDAYFTPGFTSYEHRLQYQTYDVSELLRSNENALGVILGDGWYRGSISIGGLRNFYGERLSLLLQLHVRYSDGSEQVIISDEHWRATTGPILKSDLQDGEIYDARLEMPGWDQAGFDDSRWQGVRVAEYGLANLVATVGPLVRRKERFVPLAILTTPAGETVVDMGQNLSGVVQLRVSGPAGTTIRLQHGEALDKAGNFTMEHLGLEPIIPAPLQEVLYTLKGEGEEVYTPHFTTHGFRYVKVEGFPGTPTPANFTGIALYSDMPEIGSFSCSDPRLNQLQHNILWSQKGNFLEIPTDCPTRERAGWTGDAQIFVGTGSFLMQTAGFFTKWLKDLAAEQGANGRVPNMIPSPASKLTVNNFSTEFLEGAAGWGDAAVIIPWTLYQMYGDRRILQEQYESMKAWVEYERQNAQDKYKPAGHTAPRYREREPHAHERYLWDTNFHWGEWLEPNDPVPALLFGEHTPEVQQILSAPHVATAYFANSTRLLAEAARVLGKEADAQEYSRLHEQIKQAYISEFVDKDGSITPEKQAAYVRALAFDLLPAELRPAAAAHLVKLIRSAGTHLGTGFLSTPFLCSVLGANGYLDVAYELLMQESRPSWLYAVEKGATTIWESWDGIDEEGNPHGSLNHYSYGAVGSWLYQVVAGIEPTQPGYKHASFQPQPGAGLTAASASYQSLYGEVASSWQLADGHFRLTVTVPANTSATVTILSTIGKEVTEQGQALEAVEGITGVRRTEDATLIDVGSGTYTFDVVTADPTAGTEK
ncbi:alpha-L-rhamnosidase [Ktedonosporobacter rubrisoli]|uniref:alpha-L-rhamnosidase n=1 Tax=Ktedonosporobacter rubrisoli TaxID=2509675 RepID=A0A4P6JNG6_KTERU|nr:glycoside hydrolase family 78 protein [Ktedonosporobacter rubrisoli]QBD76857.1 alpha-L-rhamnosidase [Ktedonosporobacter rubrisoli]